MKKADIKSTASDVKTNMGDVKNLRQTHAGGLDLEAVEEK